MKTFQQVTLHIYTQAVLNCLDDAIEAAVEGRPTAETINRERLLAEERARRLASSRFGELRASRAEEIGSLISNALSTPAEDEYRQQQSRNDNNNDNTTTNNPTTNNNHNDENGDDARSAGPLATEAADAVPTNLGRHGRVKSSDDGPCQN